GNARMVVNSVEVQWASCPSLCELPGGDAEEQTLGGSQLSQLCCADQPGTNRGTPPVHSWPEAPCCLSLFT
ncbi:hypothetical protein DV515_00001686, partial [Chloebia gouldiae]